MWCTSIAATASWEREEGVSLTRLIELAGAALAEADEAAAVELISGYCQALGAMSKSDMDAAVAAEPEAAKKLVQLHSRVLQRAGALRDVTAGSLKKLKTKGKGLMAYTDLLPRRISVRKKREL